MLLLAAASSVTEKVSGIPAGVWLRLGIGLLALVAVVVILRKLAKVNKVLLAVIVVVVLSMVGFNWIYERNEPAWATPVVEKLAQFFPTKGRQR